MKRTRVLLADDHKIVLDGLKSLLEPEFELAGRWETAGLWSLPWNSCTPM